MKVASEQTSELGFEGQINIVILGSNDHREISCLPPGSVNRALGKFKYKLNQFLDRMLKIENSTLILVSTVIPRQFSNLDMKQIVGQVVR